MRCQKSINATIEELDSDMWMSKCMHLQGQKSEQTQNYDTCMNLSHGTFWCHWNCHDKAREMKLMHERIPGRGLSSPFEDDLRIPAQRLQIRSLRYLKEPVSKTLLPCHWSKEIVPSNWSSAKILQACLQCTAYLDALHYIVSCESPRKRCKFGGYHRVGLGLFRQISYELLTLSKSIDLFEVDQIIFLHRCEGSQKCDFEGRHPYTEH